jgi:hypothetical protein
MRIIQYYVTSTGLLMRRFFGVSGAVNASVAKGDEGDAIFVIEN